LRKETAQGKRKTQQNLEKMTKRPFSNNTPGKNPANGTEHPEKRKESGFFCIIMEFLSWGQLRK
jgi:hypothetical protein